MVIVKGDSFTYEIELLRFTKKNILISVLLEVFIFDFVMIFLFVGGFFY